LPTIKHFQLANNLVLATTQKSVIEIKNIKCTQTAYFPRSSNISRAVLDKTTNRKQKATKRKQPTVKSPFVSQIRRDDQGRHGGMVLRRAGKVLVWSDTMYGFRTSGKKWLMQVYLDDGQCVWVWLVS